MPGRSRREFRVTEAELAVLKPLLRGVRMTIRELTRIVYPRGRSSDRATVQKLLSRLEGKGCVECDASQSPRTFRAAVNESQLIEQRLQAAADQLCEGERTPLLAYLIRAARLSPAERNGLRKSLV